MEPNAAEPVFHAVPEPAEPHLELLPGLEPLVDAPEPEAGEREAEAERDDEDEADEASSPSPRRRRIRSSSTCARSATGGC